MPNPSQPKNLSLLPFLTDKEAGDKNIYQSIGVEPIINCRGTFTIIGGSVERPEVLEAMDAASGYFVQYDELAAAVGQHLADLTGAEWGMISAGCAAGLKHVTAACVTGGNPEKLIRIPNLTGLDKTQVITPRYSRNAYDHALRNIGVELIMVDTPQELTQAINSKTAMIYVNSGHGSEPGQPLSLEVIADLAKANAIPIPVDAAAENLTTPDIHLARGATVVAYSGGKALCGPQCAGIVLGNKALLQSAWQASAPHHGPCRDNKIGKEEIMGMLAAVEAWFTRDHAQEWQTWLSRLEVIAQRVAALDSVKTQVVEPTGRSNRAPRLDISWDPAVFHISGEEVAEDFARKKPRIAVGSGNKEGRTSINITPSQMQPGNDAVVAERVYQILTQKRNPRSDALAPATTDISGYWDFTVHFFSSTSQHHMLIQQDGNWLEGFHESDFSHQSIAGLVEGDQIKIESHMHQPGNNIPFLFSGTIAKDAISGAIFLGEYQTAQFTAKRAVHRKSRTPITIPGGPPLAT